MLELQQHRGPDDAGVWSSGGVALGSRRLAILDLSPAGHQPMSNAKETLWVVYNGEIYNFEELQSELEDVGYMFRSRSDTEVLLHAYARWGPNFIERLRGMFAFALWSEAERQLMLGRDRFGIKPLYFRLEDSEGGRRFIFASEIKPILRVQSGALRPNMQLVYDFLAHGLLEHTNETFFAGVEKVPPAHYALIDRTGRLAVQRYWDFEVNDEIGEVSSRHDRLLAETFREVFLDSVRYHFVSDVPVGSCLSGGLDSSSVVCVARRLMETGRLRAPGDSAHATFTSCFDDLRYDERRYAQEVIRATDAQAHFTFPTPTGFLQELPLLLSHQEEPFAGTSVYAQWCLMRDIQRSGLKVVLDGQGGDEQLLGYGKFFLFYLQTLTRRRRYPLLAREILKLGMSPAFWLSLDVRHGLRYVRSLSSLAGEADLVAPSLSRSCLDAGPAVRLTADIAARIKRDITSLSLPVLLRYEDKNAMAFSVESRVPFVDHVLTEFVAGLPLNQKLRDGWTKFILREALRGILPEAIRTRRDKLGFVTPEAVWFRAELAREVERTYRDAAFLPECANLPRLRDAFDRFRRRGVVLSHSVFFRYFIMEHWARQFILSGM
jgi:asparagine synthase (glutamine-hydrolysing)